MKKITLVLFTLLTIITPPNAWGEEYVNNGVTYEYTPVTEGDGVATVKSVNTSAEAIEIPASFTITVEEVNHTYNITAITSNAFAGCSVLETLTIGDNVTSLSDNIFSDCTELRTLTIGNGITTITNKTFSGCTALRTLTLGTGITTINSSAFKDCSSLRTLTVKSAISLANLNIDFTHSALPNTLCIAYKGLKYYHQDSWSSGYFKVGDGSTSAGFDNTTKEGTNLDILKTVCDIPVTTITGLAFKGVAPNFTIHIPSSITTISDTSFQENKLSGFGVDVSNANYKSIDGILFSKNGETLYSYPIQKGDSYTVPDGVKTIGKNAFYKHEALTNITFPNSLEKIEQSAFQLAGRGSTLNVTFGTGLKTIAQNAFRESGVSTIIFPEKLEEIGATAFYNSAQLTAVTFPASLKSIAAGAFNECRKLTTLNFAASYETNKLTIGGSAFYNCKLQNKIILPEGVTTIGENAFNYGGSFDDSRIDNLYLPSSAVFSGTITQAKIFRKVNINFEGGKYTTYFSTMDLELPTGLTASTITGVSGTNLTTTPLHYIHQGKAILLELADGASLPEYYGIPSNETIGLDKNVVFNTDLFRGSTSTTNLNSIHGDKYILSGDKFVKIAQGTLPAFRCFLVVDNEDIDNPADYYTFNNDGNSYIYQEDGTYIKTTTDIGHASVSVNGTNGTLTVSPKTGFYANPNDVKVTRSVQASSARAPQIDAPEVTLTLSPADADPSGVTTYTFTHTSGAVYEVTVNFHKRKNLSDNNVPRDIVLTIPEGGYTYDGQEHKPTVASVTFNGQTVDSKNYDFAYTENINAGSGIVTITGKREYMNSYSKPFPIAQRSIINVTIAEIAPQTYTGEEIKPIESVTDIVNEKDIIKAEDYEITYQDNINAGTEAKVIVTAKDKNYTSVISKTFTINPKNLTGSEDLKIADIPEQKYTGNPITPALEIKDGDIILSAENDYDVEYVDHTTVGTATVKITFKGNYTGSASTTFKIKETILERTLNVSFEGENKWATYYWEDEYLTIPEGLKVYAVEGHEENSTTLKPKQLTTMIPKGVAVLLERTGDKKDNFVANTMSISTELEEGVTPDATLFVGTKNGIEDLSTETGTKFVLVNDQFVQTTGGALPANRCYLNFGSDNLEGVNTIDINTGADDIVYKVETVKSNAGGTATKSGITDGKITITVTPNEGYFVEAGNITVTRSVSASTSRAPSVDGGDVEVSAVDAEADPSGVTKYTFNASANSQYQVTIDFQKRIDFSKNKPTLTLSTTTFTYEGKEQKPEITSAVCGGKTLTADDYEISYENNINAGTGKVWITGKRKYIGTDKNTEFSIQQRDINLISVAAIEDQIYNGADITPTLTITDLVKIGDEDVDILDKVEGSPDYKVEFKNNKNVGTAQVSIVSNKVNYNSTKSGITFNILQKNLSLEENKPTIEPIDDQEYNGSELKPALVIKDGEILLVEGTDYDAVYDNNVDAGTATITITFKGNYTGTAEKTFTIVDPGLPREFTVNFDSDNEWTTYYATENLTLTGDLKAYVVTGIDGLQVTTTEENEVKFIPKNTPVLLNSKSKGQTFNVKTCSGEKLPEDITPSPLFVGTTEEVNIASIEGTKFVLLNGKFIQAAEGTVAPNRCYLVVTEPIEGVTELTINKAGNAIIYQEDGNAITANLGTASTSEPKDGKVTLTVQPKYGYYVELKDITVVKNTNAGSARAPRIDEGKVTVDSVTTTFNENYAATYEFTYPYEEGCQYQITVDFHKAANLSETGRYTTNFAPAIYNGYEQKVEPTVTYDGATLKKDVDYVLTYSGNDYINAGTKNAEIIGIRKFQNSLTREFKIEPKNVNDITVEAMEGQTWIKDHELGKTDAQVVYTGSEIKLNITDKIKDAEGHDAELLSAEQIDIIYSKDITNVGSASVIIKGTEKNYTGTKEVPYTIVAKEMTSEDIAAIPDQDYTGNEIKPALTIKYGDITLAEGEDKDYTVAYTNNINAGEATATVNFKGNYSGKDVKKTFNIVDVDETLTINFDSDNEWTTYYSSKNLTLTDNLKAYAVTGHNGKEVTTAELTFIPKETAVLLYSKSGEKTFNVETCSNETLPSDIVPDRNLFKGTLTSLDIATINGTKFVLVDGLFVQTAKGMLAANRCYLVGSIEGVTTLTIGKGISEVITYEEGAETGAAGSARVSQSQDENGNLTLTVTPNSGFYADHEHLKVVYSVNAKDARAPEVAGGEVTLTPVDGYNDTSREFKYTFPYTEGYFYQVTVNFHKCVNFLTKETQPTITLEEGTYIYDGTEKKPKIASVTIPVNGVSITLTENKDFKVKEYQNNVNAGGDAKVIITGMNHYYNEFSKNFNIAQRDINLVKVEEIPDQIYTGKELTPTLTVTDIVTIDDQKIDLLNQKFDKEGNILEDYTPEATNNINVGVADVAIKANSINYTGIKSGIHFNILPKDLSAEGNKPTIDPVEKQYYTGEPLEPKLTIHDGELLIPEDDYEVVYSNNITETTNEAPAVADITFKGNYKGTAKTTFQIIFKSEEKPLNIDFGTNDEWTTYYSPIDLKDVEGLNIFVVTGLNKGQGIDLKTEQVTFIPKNIGVLLQRTDKSKNTYTGQTMASNTTLEGVTPDTDLFRGTSTGIEDMSSIDGVKYILVDDRFIQIVEGALPANRCYVFISNEDAEGIIHVDGKDANGIIIQEEGESSTTAGQVVVELRGDGYKHITVIPASVTYATKDEIKVVRSIKIPSQESSRNRAPGIENTLVEVIPEYPNEDPSSTTHYKFEYDSDYNYQVTVNFQKRINLSDQNVSHPVVTLREKDILDLVYDGKPKTPAVEKVTCNGETVDPSNYDITYENNTNAGRPRVTITGKRFLMGSTYTEFNIGKRNFSNVTVKEPIPDQEYNSGAPIVFKGLVLEDIVDGENIVLATDYTIVCKDTEIGPATVSFMPTNNYEGSGKGPFSFNIIPATGINQIVIDELEGQWFDLNGQRIEGRPTQKGVYILRDKKQRSIKVRIK
ncbi:MAG: leucine-rich repeat domain-containing protein [Prevotella sp.]|nr:leucine-rich repeat domain-containing protein [Prevotella sp.]